MAIKIGYAQLEKMNSVFRISAADAADAATRLRANIDPIAHSVAMAAGEKSLAPKPRSTFRPTEGTSGDFEDVPADGLSTDADKQVARAHGHLDAFDDPHDDMAKHERLSRAADCLTAAAESMKAGSQHFHR
jgi:hypothetical protein